MSNTTTTGRNTNMDKSLGAQQLEAQITEASKAVDRTNVAHGPVALSHLAILQGDFMAQLAEARAFIERRQAEVNEASDLLGQLEKRVTEGALGYYAAEVEAMYATA
jgi:hypothetical protein